MVGAGSNYRKGRRKVVTTLSGAEFTIRKPGAKSLAKQFTSFGKSGKLPTSMEDIERMVSEENLEDTVKNVTKKRSVRELMNTMDTLIIDCVVIPKVVDYDTNKDDELWVEDIDIGDYFFLCQEITNFAEVSAEKLKELFRSIKKPNRPNGGNGGSSDSSET